MSGMIPLSIASKATGLGIARLAPRKARGANQIIPQPHKGATTMQTIERKPGKECGADFDTVCGRAVAYANRHNGGLELAETFINRAGWGHSIFGVEYVSCAGRELSYLNTGETYSLTIGQEGNGEVFSTSWGGWYEDAENQHCEEEGETRCGYCGEFTPCAEEWRETVCEHCGRYVDSGELPEKETEDGEDD